MERAAIAGFRVYVDDKKLLFKKPKLGEPPARSWSGARTSAGSSRR